MISNGTAEGGPHWWARAVLGMLADIMEGEEAGSAELAVGSWAAWEAADTLEEVLEVAALEAADISGEDLAGAEPVEALKAAGSKERWGVGARNRPPRSFSSSSVAGR